MIDSGRATGPRRPPISRTSAIPWKSRADLAATYAATRRRGTASAGWPEPMPRLAQLVAASPLEAAIHDAYGKTLGQNSYDLLGPEFVDARPGGLSRPPIRRRVSRPLHAAAAEAADAAVSPRRRASIRSPTPTLASRVGDGLPETLPEWIAADGLTHLKIKLNGDDLAWDVDRVLSIERVAAEAQAARGCARLALLGRLQREVRQRGVRARFPGPDRRGSPAGPAAGCSTSSSPRIATCAPTRRTACTRRRRSSRW